MNTSPEAEINQEQENIPPSDSLTPDSSSESEYHDCRSEPLTPIPIKNAFTAANDNTKDDAFAVLPPLEYKLSSTNNLDNKPRTMTIEEGVKWCQRCGTVETPRWRAGPAGQSTLCNACHLRWKTQGRPSEGYSSTVFPPPHYNPNNRKRNKPQMSNKGTKKPKIKKTTKSIAAKLIKPNIKKTTSAIATQPIKPTPIRKIEMKPQIVKDQENVSPPLTVTPGICMQCKTASTPLWRTGPLGARTLCNACGLKWAKSSSTTSETTVKSLKRAPNNTPRKAATSRKNIDMNLLHNKKEFIKQGLYYDKTRIQQNQPFSFPLPMHLGEFFISKEKEFELPPDIHQERELGLIKGLMADRMPFFTRIRSNIFVERKPNPSQEDKAICHCIPPASGEVGCGDDCINRMLFYECEPKYCPCGDQCSNRRFQRKERTKQLQVFQTKTRGWGLRTLVNIKKGDLVIEYRGEIISHQLCEERMCTIYVNDKNFYFLEYCNGEVIDACTKGSEARFINHSCEPNCHIEKWSLKGESHFGVFASQDIEAKSELFYDYNFSTFNNSVESEQPCHCGSELCRGTIGKKISRIR